MILEEVGLGKIVESVREQVEGPVMLSDDDDLTWGNACLFVTFLFLMPSPVLMPKLQYWGKECTFWQ